MQYYRLWSELIMADGPILWILGAGASKYLDLPLLAEFPQFICYVAHHRDNQRDGDRPGREASFATLQLLSQHGGDIEKVLGRYAIGTAEGDRVRECIRWCFGKRHHAVMQKRDIPYKYAAYANMLCCVQPGDRIVTFNYDSAIERTLVNSRRSDAEHFRQPRIPSECLDYLKTLSYDLPGVNGTQAHGAGQRFRLIKLHGSVNWHLANGQIQELALDQTVAVPFLVYPDPAKGELLNGAGKGLVEAARSALDDIRAVVIAGYSLPVSDNQLHPFASQLQNAVANLPIHVVDPHPSESILSLVARSTERTIWPVRFEQVFAAGECQSLRRLLAK